MEAGPLSVQLSSGEKERKNNNPNCGKGLKRAGIPNTEKNAKDKKKSLFGNLVKHTAKMRFENYTGIRVIVLKLGCNLTKGQEYRILPFLLKST